jgi:hypothetical protein
MFSTLFVFQVGPAAPELALGYLIAKFTGKFRQPFNIMLAPVISHYFPFLSKINVASLMGITGSTSNDEEKLSQKQPEDLTAMQHISKYLSHDFFKEQINKYGFSLYLAGKLNVVFTIVGSAAAFHAGIDVESWLNYLGISEKVSSAGQYMALATLLNTVLLPGHLYFTSNIVDRLQWRTFKKKK